MQICIIQSQWVMGGKGENGSSQFEGRWCIMIANICLEYEVGYIVVSRENGCQFAEDIFQSTFLFKTFDILIKNFP